MSNPRNQHNLSIKTSNYIPTNPQNSTSNSTPTGRPEKMSDMLSKECMGLPIFITDSGEAITSGSDKSTNTKRHSSSIAATPSSSTSSRRESILSPKRLSMAFDYAVTSLDSIYKHAQTLLNEDAPTRNGAQHRGDDLESGGLTGMSSERKFGEESYRDWLD